ncbi:hypothetical protein V7426_30875 [Bacillus thuringiensis]|uniref:hypothetical protein n=1 Tax=Bacillus thuringiensis TaxID=1428 RepID=UPI00148385BF|nr:hypothetical protein [Bacillus thuringiensis]
MKKISLKQSIEISNKFKELSKEEKTMVFTEVVHNLQSQNNPLVGELDQIIGMIKLKQK